MTPSESTKPIALDPNAGPQDATWQTHEEAWSFGPSDAWYVTSLPHRARSELIAGSDNRNDHEGNGHQTRSVQKPAKEARSVVKPLRPYFGKRRLQALYQWEGVVEEINGSGFRARLTPFENGRPNLGKIEFTDFDFEDLADESDRHRVERGAVFYWTVGRSRNPAGTQTNVSLVRFRRLPSAGPIQKRKAREAAKRILAEAKDQPSS